MPNRAFPLSHPKFAIPLASRMELATSGSEAIFVPDLFAPLLQMISCEKLGSSVDNVRKYLPFLMIPSHNAS
jgi:hypothetical protein